MLDSSSPTFDLASSLLNPVYRKVTYFNSKGHCQNLLKSMMSFSDDMIDTNEMNTHLQSSFMNPKKMNHHQSDSSIWTL